MATEHGSAKIGNDLKQHAGRWRHLREHLKRFRQITGEFPMYVDEPDGYESRRPNVLYHLGGPVYCQVYGNFGETTKYYTIEPELEGPERDIFGQVKDKLLERSVTKPAPTDETEYEDRIQELLEEIVVLEDERDGRLTELIQRLDLGPLEVTEETYQKVQYRLVRDIVGLGPLEPIMRDPANEDIHVIGPNQVDVDHGEFGLLETTVEFDSSEQYDNWLRNMGERIGDPVSDAHPIVDSTLPDGSRVNIIYSSDVSLKGPSLTIRQGDETPLSIFQITKWGTLSPKLSAYLWLCLENEQTVFVVGETASGKTTTLNGILSFIPQDSKIYTAEDTAEVLPPHNTWQQLLTREGGSEESTDVDMFDLVAAALRSRPAPSPSTATASQPSRNAPPPTGTIGISRVQPRIPARYNPPGNSTAPRANAQAATLKARRRPSPKAADAAVSPSSARACTIW